MVRSDELAWPQDRVSGITKINTETKEGKDSLFFSLFGEQIYTYLYAYNV